ncbi:MULTISPECIES: hypothetical protein [unclassified Roseateles]|uniref:hypothetical protein n=1 Tax=unclassified Roseateles TaxID=2626991 RepID=UPI0006F97C06|nr:MULTISPECIES: hypothetical protein [unclassified Roseateles]KQW44925.1 hypothetical protein ASC81_15290 [Pelomonas sp. Root405]KRA70285.1 hypothetical protein ASD88_19450 [Pelomonas sp. Root662]
MNSPFPTLHAPLFVLVVFGTLVGARLSALLIPIDFYFTFESLFSDRTAHNHVLALLTKTASPLLVGLAAGVYIVAFSRPGGARAVRSSLARRVRNLYGPTLFAAGFFASLLSAWPAMVYWDLLANPAVAHLKPAFLGLYAIYMLAFGYVTVLGMLFGIYLVEHWAAGPPGTESVSMKELARVGGLWLLNSSIASFAMKALTT